MVNKNCNRFFRVLGLTSTIDLLKSIQEGKNQYKDFLVFTGVATINRRLRQLIKLGIIEHHFERKNKRNEWYTLTEKGKRILEEIKKLENIFEEEVLRMFEGVNNG
ncbi:MAG: winged helix-turn-helix transcriptional regulator [Theionarchaea archaeon]|nr:winged helix-turn-helix transcriptional regulator [Theionarchaea archaeon]